MNTYINRINQPSPQSKALLLLLSLVASPVMADDIRTDSEQTFDNCVLRQIHMDVEQDSLEKIKAQCEQEKTAGHAKTTIRHELEKETVENPFVITPYRQNYLLPITHMKSVNKNPYNSEVFGDAADGLSDEEIKFQISFKVPLITDDIFNESDELYFGFTLKSFWQAYSSDISAPFRDTNYRPEVFYETKLPIEAGAELSKCLPLLLTSSRNFHLTSYVSVSLTPLSDLYSRPMRTPSLHHQVIQFSSQ